MKKRKNIAKILFIILTFFIINCIFQERINRIILPQTIETKVGKHTGMINLGFHIPPFSANHYFIADYEKNVIIEPLGFIANFVYIKPQMPISFLFSQGTEDYFGELHLYLSAKPLSPGIGINRLWATNFKSTNFSILLNFISDNYNVYGSFGYLRTPVYREQTHTTAKVQSSTIGINGKPAKNFGCFLIFSNFYIFKGLKSYEPVNGEFVDIKYNVTSSIIGLYIEF